MRAGVGEWTKERFFPIDYMGCEMGLSRFAARGCCKWLSALLSGGENCSVIINSKQMYKCSYRNFSAHYIEIMRFNFGKQENCLVQHTFVNSI